MVLCNKTHWRFGIVICGLLLIAACERQIAVPPEITITQSISTPNMPSLTLSPRPPAFTPQPSATLEPSATITLLPSWTPLPTLAPIEAQNLILDLLQNNTGCRLPCWWGFKPGITRWEDARRFLETFAKIIDYPGSPTDKIYNPEVVVPVPENIHPLRHLGYTYYTIDAESGKVIKQISAGTGDVPAYKLPAILSEYGQPDEVWFISSAGVSGSHNVPFDVILFYSSQNFAIEYLVDVPLRMPIVGCPQEAKYPWLWVWSENNKKTFKGLAGETENFRYGWNSLDFVPLEQATGLSVDAFYDTFKEETNTTCLETPFELWLSPGQTILSTVVITMTPTP